jgi:hypothetical protein
MKSRVLIVYVISASLGLAWLGPSVEAASHIAIEEEWVDVPVLANIVDGTDVNENQIDVWIRKANEILAQAHIRLILKHVNTVDVGNGDADLTYDEGNKAKDQGRKELRNRFGAPRGIKIYFADDCWIEKPNTAGWSIHRSQVIVIEPDPDANEMGEVITHELLHDWTVPAHSNDVNDVMYRNKAGNGFIHPNDVNEVFPEAKKRGYPYTRRWYWPWPDMLPWAFSPGYEPSIDLRGATLDDYNDLSIFDPCGVVTQPNDPTIQYADLQEILVFSDNPFDPCAILTVELQFGGPPADWPFETSIDMGFDLARDSPGPEAVVSIWIPGANEPEATWSWLVCDPGPNCPVVNLPPPVIHENESFDGNEPPPIVNNSLEVTIPIELVGLSLRSVEPIMVDANSFTLDLRNGPNEPISIEDLAGPFEVRLTGLCPTGPQIRFVPDGISGCGFAPGAQVSLDVDGVIADHVTVNSEGAFLYDSLLIGLEPGRHSVIVKDTNDSGPGGADHAIGFFGWCPGGKPIGDFNDDCDEDFGDFAWFALDWLNGVGCQPEVCNGEDDDCDGEVDEGLVCGVCTPGEIRSCGSDIGECVSGTETCDQNGFWSGVCADEIVPSTEECDGLDNDCDGQTDEPDAVDATTWYMDDDEDNYGDAAVTLVACDQPAGYVTDNTDCDDTDAMVYPGATEYCDGVDNDCDGQTDEPDAVDASTWYADTDSDGYGDPAVSVVNCYQPAGYVADNTDCDDTHSSVNPGAEEICDNDIDDDCDTLTDYYDLDCPYPACWDCLAQCHGDADCSGTVDAIDLNILNGAMDTCTGDLWYDPCADFDRDGCVDSDDEAELWAWLGYSPPSDCPPGPPWVLGE